MATQQQKEFLSEVLTSETLSLGHRAYFRGRLRNRLYDLAISEFLRQEKAHLITRADLARRMGKHPSQITRWLSTPGNWTLDTISDLMLAMRTEPGLSVSRLAHRSRL